MELRTLHERFHALLPEVEVVKLAVQVLDVRPVYSVEFKEALLPRAALLLQVRCALLSACQGVNQRVRHHQEPLLQVPHLQVVSGCQTHSGSAAGVSQLEQCLGGRVLEARAEMAEKTMLTDARGIAGMLNDG